MSNLPPVPPLPPDDKAPAKVFHKLLDYAVENPLKTLSTAVLIVGGVILLAFLADIGFLPDLDLAGAVSMLYAVALLALMLVLSLAGLLILPGPAISALRKGLGGSFRPATRAVAPTGYPAEPMSVKDEHAPRAEAFPWIFAVLGWVVMMVWQVRPDVLAATAGSALVCIAAARWWVHGDLVASRQGSKHGWSLEWRMWFESGVAFLVFVMPVFVILQLTVVGDLGREPVSVTVLATLTLTLAVSAAIALVLSMSKPRSKIGIGLVILLALVLLFLVASQTHSMTAIPHAVVRKLGLGDVAFARIALTPAGCRQVNAALGSTACAVPAEAEAMAPLCPVRIRSRIGQQLVLEFGDVAWNDSKESKRWIATWAEADQRMRRVVIDKSQMPSWQPLQVVVELPAAPASAASAAGRVTLWRGAADPGSEALKQLCEARIEPAAVPAPPASVASAAAPPASAPPPPQASLG